MRNISQIILNIDVMKELKNLEAIRELLASHPIYTYDYSDGLLINKEDTNIQVYSIDLEDEPFAAYISGYIITYASEEVLFENLRENIISHMDLTKGKFLVSFEVPGHTKEYTEGFTEEMVIPYRTEELNPYLRYPNQEINNNHLHSEHIRLQIREMLQIPLTDITIIDIISLP